MQPRRTLREGVDHQIDHQAKEKATPQRASAQGRFVRSGSVAGWRDKLSASQTQLIEHYAGGAMSRLGYEGASKFAETLAEVRG